FSGCPDAAVPASALKASGFEAVLYLDVNQPSGIGLLLMSEDPSFFTGAARSFLNAEPFSSLRLRARFTMFGRTYSGGHEQDVEDWLLKKPRRNVFNESLDW